jgi:hypothetical protein
MKKPCKTKLLETGKVYTSVGTAGSKTWSYILGTANPSLGEYRELYYETVQIMRGSIGSSPAHVFMGANSINGTSAVETSKLEKLAVFGTLDMEKVFNIGIYKKPNPKSKSKFRPKENV